MGYVDDMQLELPNDETRIWRYVDFATLIAILESSTLWFTRLGAFRDSFEGVFSLPVTMTFVTESAIRQQLSSRDAYEYFRAMHSALNAISKRFCFANCWHGNQGESIAQWELYGDAIAIRSTIGQLKASLHQDSTPEIRVGAVNYVEDPEIDTNPNSHVLQRALTKRSAYAHEREIRALFTDFPVIEKDEDLDKYPILPGHNVPVDLSNLIEGILVSLNQSSWFKALVERVMVRYGYENVPVEWSALRKTPTYHASRSTD